MDFSPAFTRCLLLLASLLLAPAWVGAAPVAIEATTTQLALDGRLDWWPGAPPAAALETVRAADAAFEPAPARAAFGWHPEPAWFRVLLANNAPHARELVLEVAFANLAEVDLHVVHADAAVTSWRTGTGRGAEPRALRSPLYAFPLQLEAGETATLYLRVVSETALNVPLALYDGRAYADHVGNTRGWQGLFYGIIVGILMCAAFLWRTTGDRTFPHFLVAVLVAMLFFLGLDGYLAYWFPAQAASQTTLMFFGACLSAAFSLSFARAFFHAAGQRRLRMDPWLHRLAWFIGGTALLLLVLPPVAGMGMSMFASLAMAVCLLLTAIEALRLGFRPARLLLVAMVVHIITVGLLSFSAVAEVPGLFGFADSFHRFGFLFLLVCLTVAMGQRIRAQDEERRRAGEIVLQTEADARARSEFQSRMSHELRTPMTGVLGMAELLEHTELDSRQRRYLATLRYSGEILLNLINDMLDHARIESGRLRLRREAFDLLRLVDECRMLFEQQPRDDGSVLRMDIGTGSSRVVVGDGPRVRQVLVTVLMRAFRATGGRPVELRVQAMSAPGWLRFEVGCGGVTGDAAGDDTLATSCRLCAMMGGELAVQPVPGGGTLYRIDLPLHAAS